MNNITVIVLGVIVHDGKILLTKRYDTKEPYAHGRWQIPGGALNFGELPHEGIKRELKEELGTNIKVIKTVSFIDNRFIKDQSNNTKWHGLKIFFLCKPDTYDFILNEEATEWKWFSKEEAKTIDHFGSVVEIFEFI